MKSSFTSSLVPRPVCEDRVPPASLGGLGSRHEARNSAPNSALPGKSRRHGAVVRMGECNWR